MSRKLFHVFFILILVTGLVITERPPAVRAAGPWYVSLSGDDNNDCLSPATPCATINGAIGKASSGDSIFVSVGTYTGTGDQVVLIDKSLTLSGGWDHAFTTQDDVSILDGQSVQRGVTINSDVEAIIENVQVQNGFNNIAGGGGIYNSGTLTLNNSHIADNTATSSATGGGILNIGSMTIRDSTVSRNDANSGGGISNMGTMTLNNSILENNDALTGGGVANFNVITLNSSIITNNTAQTGGGIHASGAISVNSSIIKENTARSFGGGINADGGTIIIIENSIVSNNVASSASGFGYGGGIHNYGNTLTITNSTIGRNLSVNGGGIFNGNSGISNLNSSTISGNTAEFGGGILSDSGTVTMRNLIIAGNTATLSSPDCTGGAFASLVSAGYNLIGNTANCNFPAASTDLIDVDPKLSLLMGPSGTPNYYPLITGSPAIDAGNPAGCTDQDGNLLTTDQRGVTRDSTCDIGAYEFTAPGPAVSLSVAGGDNQITGTSSAFPTPLQAAALDSQGSPVGNVTVDFTAPSSGPSGTFANPVTNTTSAVTDEGGVAAASVFTANDQAGAYTVTAAAAGLGSVEFNLEQVDRPANDNFGDAVSILSLPFSAITDISNAGIEPGEPHVCFTTESTIWYSLTPTETTNVHLNTQGSAISANITIYRAAGPGIADLQFLQCANSSDSFLAEANQTYYIQVRPGFGESGLVQVNLAALPIITGRVTDAVTSAPLPGNAPPFASIILRRVCGDGCLEFVSSQNADSEGRFLFDNYFGGPLPTGAYQVEVSANSYQTKQFAPFEFDGVNLNLGDLPIDPLPAIGSIRGRLVDAATGAPVSGTFTPSVQLYRCTDGNCSEFVNSQVPDSQGRFRFEIDSFGNPLTVGTYRVVASADQYQEAQTELIDVGAGMHRSVGNIRITSFPVRFSHVQPCTDVPASGGECSYSVRIWNGLPTRLRGDAWSVVNATMPDSFAAVTDFEIKELQFLNLDKGRSRIFRFRFRVPGTSSPTDAFICTRLFVGQGLNFRFNTIGFRELFCIFRSAQGLTIASPQDTMALAQENVTSASTGTEVEPNNSCQTAQNVGAVPLPYVLDGNLDSSAEPDIDFYRFSGTAGMLITIDHEGQATGKGTLGNPFLGVFDSNCNLMDLNDDFNSLNSHLEITIPSDGVFTVGATVCCDSGFVGGGEGSYQLSVAPVQLIGSITGRVTNAISGMPLSGDAEPFAFVRLLQCDDFGCGEVKSQAVDSEGRFLFVTDSNRPPLRVGNYQVVVSANQYRVGQTEPFAVGESENYDLGNFALTPFPVLFSEIQPCSIPSEGGLCSYSVKITNGLATRLSGKAWSVASGSGTGSFAGLTVFQTGLGREVRLNPGQSTTLRFRFRVPGSVANGATICALAYVGQNPNPFFHPVGLELVFCLTKGAGGFTLLSVQDAQAASQQMQLQLRELDPPTR